MGLWTCWLVEPCQKHSRHFEGDKLHLNKKNADWKRFYLVIFLEDEAICAKKAGFTKFYEQRSIIVTTTLKKDPGDDDDE